MDRALTLDFGDGEEEQSILEVLCQAFMYFDIIGIMGYQIQMDYKLQGPFIMSNISYRIT